MTLRTWINRWWANDPLVHPCPRCGCPLQVAPRLSLDAVLEAHFDVVHAGEAPPALAGAS